MRIGRWGWALVSGTWLVAGCASAVSPIGSATSPVDGGGKADTPSDLAGFGVTVDAAMAPSGGCSVGGVAGAIDSSSGKCVYRLCASSTECTAKASPMSGIGARPIDGRFPVMATITNLSNVTDTYPAVSTPNATALCARYGSEYWAHVRKATLPSCGSGYGLARASNASGAFDAQDYPLCSLAYAAFPNNPTGKPDSAFPITGIPLIEEVWCKKTAESTGAATGVTPPTFNSFNTLPFDTDPHDNYDPRYQYVDPGGGGGA